MDDLEGGNTYKVVKLIKCDIHGIVGFEDGSTWLYLFLLGL